MKASRWLIVGLLVGCATGGPRAEVFSSQGRSTADSFLCARRAVTDLGYQTVSADATREILRAARSA